MQPARTAYIKTAETTAAQAMQRAGIGDMTNIDSVTSEYLSLVISPVTNCNISRYCRRSLNKALEKVPQNADIQYVKNYLHIIAKREEQANQAGSNVLKEYLKDNKNIGYDLFAVLYAGLAEACK